MYGNIGPWLHKTPPRTHAKKAPAVQLPGLFDQLAMRCIVSKASLWKHYGVDHVDDAVACSDIGIYETS